MKGWIIGLIFSSSSVFALYNGCPAAPKLPEEGRMTSLESWMTIKMGYLGMDVFNRYLQHTSKFHWWANGGTLSFDLFNRISLYGFAGGMRMSVTKNHHHYLTNLGICGLAGISAILLEKNRFLVGLDAAYFQGNPTVESSHNSNRRILYREAHIGCSCTYSFTYFYPYVGLKLSYAHAHMNGSHRFSANSECPVGIFAGLTFTAPTTIAVTFEGEFLDELAIAGTITARF